MTIHTFPLRSLEVYEEPDGSFNVDNSANRATAFLPVPAQPDSLGWTPEQPLQNPNVLQQYKHGLTKHVLGPKGWTLQATMPIHGSGLAGDASTASADKNSNALTRLLGAVFGGVHGGNNGSTVATGTSATAFDVQAGDGSNFLAGGAIGWVNSSGLLEIREIESVSTDTITLKHELSATPSTSDTIYNATTFYLDDGNTSLQFISEGKVSKDYYLLSGGQLESISFNLPLGDIPTVTANFRGAEWTNLGSNTLSAVSYSNVEYMSFKGGWLHVTQLGTAAPNRVKASEFTMESSLAYVFPKGPDGEQTLLPPIQSHQPPVVSGSFRPYFEDTTWEDAWTNQTDYDLALQFGRTSNRGCLFSAPTIQIGPTTAPEDIEGLSGQTVNFMGRLDEDTTDQSTAIRRSAMRLHIVG